MRDVCTLKKQVHFYVYVKVLAESVCFYVAGLMTSKKDSTSESTLSLPPGEESKSVTDKDGKIIL